VIKAYLLAAQTRIDLLQHLDDLSARIMLFVGTRSPFANEGCVHRCPSHPLITVSHISRSHVPAVPAVVSGLMSTSAVSPRCPPVEPIRTRAQLVRLGLLQRWWVLGSPAASSGMSLCARSCCRRVTLLARWMSSADRPARCARNSSRYGGERWLSELSAAVHGEGVAAAWR
jgi:hypothetical protein